MNRRTYLRLSFFKLMPAVLMAVFSALTAPAVETVLENFNKPDDLSLGGQLLQPNTKLTFIASGGVPEAMLTFNFVSLKEGIPTAGIQFPPGSRVLVRPSRRLLVAVRGDRAGLPLRVTFDDASGEMHMYQLEPTDRQGPGGSVIYATDLSRPGFFTWGGDNNKRPDYPLSLKQLFIDGNGNTGASASVFFSAITVDAERSNRPTQAGMPVVVRDYGEPNAVAVGGNELDPASRMTIVASGPFDHAVNLHYRFVEKEGAFPSCGIRFPEPITLKNPVRQIRVPVRGDGSRIPIRLNLLDASNELHMFTTKAVTAAETPDGFRWIGIDLTDQPLFSAGGDGDKVIQWPVRIDLLFLDGNRNAGVEGDLVIGPVSVVPDDEAAPATARVPVQTFVLDDGERCRTEAFVWGDKGQPEAAVILDTTQAFAGKGSYRMDFQFKPVAGGQSVFIGFGHQLPEGTTNIGVAVRSAGCDRLVHATLIDSKGTFHTVTLGTAPADRWQELHVDISQSPMAWPVFWRDVVVAHDANTPLAGTVWVDALKADLPVAPAQRMTTELDLGRWPAMCWGPKDAPKAVIVVRNGAAEAATLPMEVKLYDHRRRQLGEVRKSTATATVNEPFRQEIPLMLPVYGVYELEVRLGDRTDLHSFSWLPERSPQWADGPFGVNTTPPALLPAMADIGMAWTRAEFGWRVVEHSPGVFEDGAFRRPIQQILGANMSALLNIGDWGPDQCMRAGKSPDSPALYAGYAAFTAYMAKSNPGLRTRHFQIWNEPNLGGFWWPQPDVTHYAETLKACYAAIKAVDPKAQVMGVNMSCIDLPFLEELLKQGCGKSMDVMGLHPYHLPEPPERFKRAVPSPTLNGEFPPGTFLQQMAKMQEVLDRYGAGHVKLWLDEFGYPDRPDLYPDFASEEWRAGALVVRQSLLALSIPQVERLLVYNCRDVATGNPGNWDNATGFMRSDGSPKARCAGWATMTRLLNERRFARSIAVAPDCFAYEFTGPKGPVVALWCMDGATTLSFTGTGAKPSITDSMGNAVALIAQDGAITVALSEEPRYLAGWSDTKMVANRRTIAGDLRCAPGESAEITVAGARGAWTCDVPRGWVVHGENRPGIFKLQPTRDAMVGTIPVILTGDGAVVGATLRYDDSVRVSARPAAYGVRVTVDNPYGHERKLTITSQAANKALVTSAVAAAKRQVTMLDIPISGETDTGFTTVPVTISAALAAGEIPSSVVVGVGRKVVFGVAPCLALKGGAMVGKPCLLNEAHQWVPCNKDAVRSAENLSGTFRSGWDAKRLVIDMSITDDRHQPHLVANDLWQGDSLQFAFGNAGVRYEFDIAIPEHGGNAMTMQHAPVVRPNPILSATGTRIGTVTTYHVEVPWSIIGVDDPLKAELGFALLVNDDDGAGRSSWMEWCEGIGKTKDATLLGSLRIMR